MFDDYEQSETGTTSLLDNNKQLNLLNAIEEGIIKKMIENLTW